MALILKLLLAPLLVVASSLAGRRWGARVTGLLIALPIVAGPILLVTCLEQGRAFGARAAASSLFGLVTLALFAVGYAWCARRLGWAASLAVSWLATLAADLGLARLTLPTPLSLLIVLAAAALTAKALTATTRSLTGAARSTTPRAASLARPPVQHAASATGQLTAVDEPTAAIQSEADLAPQATSVAWPWWDLPGRAAATAVLVVAVTTAAGIAGPRLTGVLAPFPIATSVVAAFVRAQRGPLATAETLQGVPRGLLGFATFCFLVALLVERLGTPAAFGIAVAAALAVQFAFRAVTARGNPSGP